MTLACTGGESQGGRWFTIFSALLFRGGWFWAEWQRIDTASDAWHTLFENHFSFHALTFGWGMASGIDASR